MTDQLQQTKARFLSHTEISDNPNSCWLWQGKPNPFGYGYFNWDGKHKTTCKLAHRAAYELWRGAIPKGLCVLHTCDTPACVNPLHLWLGTRQENNHDRDAKNRTAKGAEHYTTKLTADAVLTLRRLYQEGAEIKELAQQFGMTITAVFRLATGITWKHLPGATHRPRLYPTGRRRQLWKGRPISPPAQQELDDEVHLWQTIKPLRQPA